MNRLIIIGSVYPQFLIKELTNRKQYADYPANVFQHSLLKGLNAHYPDMRVITSPVIRSKYQVVLDICKKSKFSYKGTEELTDTYVGTFPFPGLQMLVELKRIYSTLKKEIQGSKFGCDLIVYALHSPFLLATVLLHRRIRCSCVVIPDLPEFMSSGSGIIKRIGKRINRTLINYCLKRLDCFAVLSPYMCDKLPIKNKPWTLIEGIYDVTPNSVKVEKAEGRVILYTGNLSRKYGIIELLQAFRRIDKENYRLWICGRGDAEEDIMNLAKLDSRITFFGVVSHDEVLELQQKASVLVNPRSSEGEYTKYSFPSKTMEYLASGTPTVMCHLPAIPKEYDDYLYYITEENTDGIKAKLLEVCEKSDDELFAFGKRAAEFIKNKKNAYVQAKKVVDLMNATQSRSGKGICSALK